MKEFFKNLAATLYMAVAILAVCALFWVMIRFDTTPKQEAKEIASEERAVSTVYDTTCLEYWDGEPQGQVRMIGGWFFNYEPSSGLYTVEDESGELWCLAYPAGAIDENDFLLLWIDDCGTPDFPEDDRIIKAWKEVH